MNIFERYVSSEREKKAKSEAYQRIRIEDYGDEIVFTIDGIKADVISGDIEKDVEKLKRMRNDFVKDRT